MSIDIPNAKVMISLIQQRAVKETRKWMNVNLKEYIIVEYLVKNAFLFGTPMLKCKTLLYQDIYDNKLTRKPREL